MLGFVLCMQAITEHLAPHDILAARNACRAWRTTFGAHWSRVVARIPGADHVLLPHKLHPHPMLTRPGTAAQHAQRSLVQNSASGLCGKQRQRVQTLRTAAVPSASQPSTGPGQTASSAACSDGEGGGDPLALLLSPNLTDAAMHVSGGPNPVSAAVTGSALLDAFPAAHAALLRLPGAPCGPGARAGSAMASVYAHVDQVGFLGIRWVCWQLLGESVEFIFQCCACTAMLLAASCPGNPICFAHHTLGTMPRFLSAGHVSSGTPVPAAKPDSVSRQGRHAMGVVPQPVKPYFSLTQLPCHLIPHPHVMGTRAWLHGPCGITLGEHAGHTGHVAVSLAS